MDRPNPRTLTDQQLASFLGNRQDLIRFFRAFIKYLSESVPDAVDDVQSAADGAAVAAALSQTIASAALQIAQQITDGPSQFHQPPPDTPDDLAHIVHAQQAQIHALTHRVAALEESPTP